MDYNKIIEHWENEGLFKFYNDDNDKEEIGFLYEIKLESFEPLFSNRSDILFDFIEPLELSDLIVKPKKEIEKILEYKSFKYDEEVEAFISEWYLYKFDNKMFDYCEKEPSPDFFWSPEWLMLRKWLDKRSKI